MRVPYNKVLLKVMLINLKPYHDFLKDQRYDSDFVMCVCGMEGRTELLSVVLHKHPYH
jgi:hypothetical protein